MTRCSVKVNLGDCVACSSEPLCYALHMADEVNTALARIDAALRRIEAVAARPVSSHGAPEPEARHLKLRASVEESIAALDNLIANGAVCEGGGHG